jgi:hypothetical protein
MKDRPVVVLAPEGDVTPLRFMAHMEAGDQVIYEGDLTAEHWWPAVEPRVHAVLDDRRWEA